MMADIARDIAQVFFASVFVGPLLGGEVHLVIALCGFLLSVGLWYSSVLLIGVPAVMEQKPTIRWDKGANRARRSFTSVRSEADRIRPMSALSLAAVVLAARGHHGDSLHLPAARWC
jgi:hypothetical protein